MYIWIEADSDCGDERSTLYNEEGVKYCRNNSSLDCFEFYDLEEYDATVLWTCDGENPTEEEPNFEDYEWLSDLIDTENCCDNTTVTEYDNGSYAYIFVETDSDCGGVNSTLYNEEGVKYFRNNSSLDCFEFYDLEEYEATVLWTCEGESGFKINNAINETNELDFRLYPNPAKDYINIKLDKITSEFIQVQIIDYTGRVLKSMNLASLDPISISIDDLTLGTYLLSVFDGEKFATQKFIKTN